MCTRDFKSRIFALTMIFCCAQESTQAIGPLPSPVLPPNVTGELDLTQSLAGPLDNGTASTRGYSIVPSGVPNFTNGSQVCNLSQSTNFSPCVSEVL